MNSAASLSPDAVAIITIDAADRQVTTTHARIANRWHAQAELGDAPTRDEH